MAKLKAEQIEGLAELDVVVENEYADIATMLADQGNQTSTFLQYVTDASADPTVTSGDMYYEYLGTTVGDLTDYRKLGADEIEIIGKGSMRIIDQLSADFKAKLKFVFGTGFIAVKRKDGGVDLDLAIGVTELADELKATNALGSVSGSTNLDWDDGIHHTLTMTAATTLVFLNIVQGKTITLEVDGNFVLTLPTGFKALALNDFDGTKVNYIQVYCANSSTPIYLSGLEAR